MVHGEYVDCVFYVEVQVLFTRVRKDGQDYQIAGADGLWRMPADGDDMCQIPGFVPEALTKLWSWPKPEEAPSGA